MNYLYCMYTSVKQMFYYSHTLILHSTVNSTVSKSTLVHPTLCQRLSHTGVEWMTPGELIIQDVPKIAHLLRAFDFMCNMTHVANGGSQMKTLAMNTNVSYLKTSTSM